MRPMEGGVTIPPIAFINSTNGSRRDVALEQLSSWANLKKAGLRPQRVQLCCHHWKDRLTKNVFLCQKVPSRKSCTFPPHLSRLDLFPL